LIIVGAICAMAPEVDVFAFGSVIPSPDDEYNSYVVPVCSRLRQPEGPLTEYFARA
jgi:hypothetical protein